MQATSLRAYESEVRGSLGARQRFVLGALSDVTDMTNSEICQKLNIPINTVTPRVKELREQGLVVLSKKRVCSVTGRLAMAWKRAHAPAAPIGTPVIQGQLFSTKNYDV